MERQTPDPKRTLLRELLQAKLEYKRVPLLTLWVIPLAFVSSFLGGTGHAPLVLYIPYSLLFGPLAVLGFFWGTGLSGVLAVCFAIAGPYPLYLFYGFVWVFLSAKSQNFRLLFLAGVLVVHISTAVLFLYLADLLK